MRFSYLSILLLLILPFLLFFVTSGVVLSDEGYILYSSEKMMQGLLPYRDFHFVYTPLSLFLTYFSFVVFKASILSSRIMILLVYLLSSFLIYKIIISATRNKLYATFALLLFVAWSPTHINFSNPIVFAVNTALLTCYFLMKFIETRKERYLFAAGFSTFLVFLSKQNFGVAMLLPITVFFAIKHVRKINYILFFSYGLIWSFIFFLIYLIYTDSLRGFINDFRVFIIQGMLIKNDFSISFINDGFLKMVIRITFYLIPLVFSAASFIIIFKRRRFHLLFLPTFVIALYIVSIRLTNNYIYLFPLLSLVGIPISLYLRYNIFSTIRIFILFFSIFMIILGFYTGLFKGYYGSNSPLIQHNRFYKHSRVNIFINNQTSEKFNQLIKITDKYSKKNGYILVNSYSPLIYFITNRKDPIKHTFISADFLSREYYNEVIGNLVAKQIPIIIIDHNSLQSIPIKAYIEKNYKFIQTIEDFVIYVLRP